jgi:hypothetical protein
MRAVKAHLLGRDALQSVKSALLDVYVLAYFLSLMIASVYSSQTSDNFYQNTRHHIPKNDSARIISPYVLKEN